MLALVKPDLPMDMVVAVPVEQACPVQGGEGGEREMEEVVERISLVQGEEGEEREISVMGLVGELAPIPLTETKGTGRMGDLEEEEKVEGVD